MIYGNINDPDSFAALTLNPAWREAFEILKTISSETPLGITQLKGDLMYMNVMEYHTLPREECRFETHRKYVDLQYTITGAEVIEWRRSPDLDPDGGYDESKDLQFYQLGGATARIHMLPGYFSIFYPTDAHLPKVNDGVNSSVYKVVIKVSLELLNQI